MNPLNLHPKNWRALSRKIATTFWVPSVHLGLCWRLCMLTVIYFSQKLSGLGVLILILQNHITGAEKLLIMEPGFPELFLPG